MPELLALHQLPLFPLNTVLYPGGSLQLQIFEVRYLDLMGKCHKTGAPFGVVALTQGSEVRRADPQAPSGDGFAHEAFVDIGTLATITEFSSPQPGLMVLRCTAGERFRITQRSRMKHGLWVADVQALPADVPTPVPPDLQLVSQALQNVVAQLQARGGELPASLRPPHRLDDCGWVANRWCELLQLPPDLKQSLMQLDNPLLRLELVGDFLSRAGISG
ncbi:MAG: peptidase S16 [Curvibacter sp. RIFCSPHIGHO2_12_FULL_63_18]|uniref:LON peptidase substrate-binding domain-containing protein n=1 Tax=Rhodoferax sp. TaxID=50421 RepID=UPI0008ACE322|nr:LON peptidase substrate-binding domain-containing protein [Rhodoferax sp.]OGO99105.1 MAG: peptidase S16 [Curvibacter sp. RIFCSPHIGHO2_12_FULL_63_18]OGP00328.1 MAG: peptidase S16 [Curvibacter sp. GWA2_63_95]HCX82129.1 peptidase S16 [Rhodoferax sp.]